MNINNLFRTFTGHEIKCISSFRNFVELMYQPVDAASLGIGRFLFGLLMLIDIPEERGGSEIDFRWGESRNCNFPLFSFIQPMSLPRMGIVYVIMWLGSIGITLGYKFRLTSIMFVIPYWYIFLLDKSVWNNHSYLYGLCGILFMFSNAHRYFSIDSWQNPHNIEKVPFWNYFLLKYQFFILYFVAGLKKICSEWLSGYAMSNLSYHWVFYPFRFILGAELTDLLIIHWFGCLFDLTIAFWLIFSKTRPMATLFAVTFHFMNSRLFTIGMFPWVCLAELPLFYNVDWPRCVLSIVSGKKNQEIHDIKDENVVDIKDNVVKDQVTHCEETEIRIRKMNKSNAQHVDVQIKPKYKKRSANNSILENYQKQKTKQNINFNQKLVVTLIIMYCFTQAFLPYSHFITKGYNNWTDGIYGYSWDMMVHAWDTVLIVIKIVDNAKQKTHFLEPFAFTENDRWTKHADLAHEFAKCIDQNIKNEYQLSKKQFLTPDNYSIYFDVWCSLNGRFQQRVYDPNVDILTAKWNPFEQTKWVLPLLKEFTYLRKNLQNIHMDVLSWSNYSDAMFIADFPNLEMDNYISLDLDNVTLTVIDGIVNYQPENDINNIERINGIKSGQSIKVKAGQFHKIKTVSETPACYMYSYVNKTMQLKNNRITIEDEQLCQEQITVKPMLPLWNEFLHRCKNYKQFLINIGNSILYVIYKVPMTIRLKTFN